MAVIRRKGIVLAGGTGSRLYPLTRAVTKQLLPIYDKPMIYYPLSVLMLSGIREILIISTPSDLPTFEALFGDGSDFGISLCYAKQFAPNGIAEAYLIGESFLNSLDAALILGDNLFFGQGLSDILRATSQEEQGGTIFGYAVRDPERYGVVTFDGSGQVTAINEKPEQPRSNIAVTGLYFHDSNAPEIVRSLKPSARGELEITDLNRAYLEAEQLSFRLLGRGTAWLDAGTPEALLDASTFVGALQRRQGLKVACLEEIAWRNGWLDDDALVAASQRQSNTDYGAYLAEIALGAEGSR